MTNNCVMVLIDDDFYAKYHYNMDVRMTEKYITVLVTSDYGGKHYKYLKDIEVNNVEQYQLQLFNAIEYCVQKVKRQIDSATQGC